MLPFLLLLLVTITIFINNKIKTLNVSYAYNFKQPEYTISDCSVWFLLLIKPIPKWPYGLLYLGDKAVSLVT